MTTDLRASYFSQSKFIYVKIDCNYNYDQNLKLKQRIIIIVLEASKTSKRPIQI